MRPPTSSKNPKKKKSDDDRSKKKKIKSKSAKRQRGSSISSSSPESEPDSRSRQKSSKSKKLEKRRKPSKLKKSDKIKSRKKRYYSDSSVSSDSKSSDSRGRCPTCLDSEGSRSPVRKKSKRRKRDRKSSRLYESKPKSKSKRTRYRSPSRSPCSDGGRGRSRSRSRSPSLNPIEDRFDGGRGCSPFCERFGGGRGCSPFGERFSGGRGGSPFGERFGDSGSRGQSPVEDRYRYKEERGTKRLMSVLAVTKPSDVDEDKIIKAYDDYPSSQGNEVYDDGNKERDLDAKNGTNEFHDGQIRNEVGLSKDMERPIKDSLVCEPELAEDCSKEEEVDAVGGDGGKESDDLELILRQKALENFRKFRGRRHDNSDSLGDKKDETSKPEFHEGSENFMKTSEFKHIDSLDDPNELKARSVGHVPAEKNDGSGSFRRASSAITCQDTSKNLKRVHKFSNEISADETSLPNAIQDKTVVAEPISGNVIRSEVSTSDMPPSSVALNTDNQDCKSNEHMVGITSGSQFEQKTFSRVRDGETVQVRYKVYIPKKTPALARRQLQR